MCPKCKKAADYKRGGKKESREVAEGKMEEKVSTVMKEGMEGKLHSGSKKGPIVTDKKQMIAIALSKGKKAKDKKPKKKK